MTDPKDRPVAKRSMKKIFDGIVVGSGAGGAAVACELAKRGKDILGPEAGPGVTDRRLGGMLAAAEILKASGASRLAVTKVWRGAHPGGTAAIGEVVDNNLKVPSVKGLYVCDASTLPFAPDLPPILTITALAKWPGKRM